MRDRYSWAVLSAETDYENGVMRSFLEKQGMREAGTSEGEGGARLVMYTEPPRKTEAAAAAASGGALL